ncbi:MAG: DUF3025 domain-containing protein [Gammaproteobacteria bacterium]|nr:DUF3025 domain-containing protein [Gammaproteobacteria bacterium]
MQHIFSTKIDFYQKWDANFTSFSPIFLPLKFWADQFSAFDKWPGLDDYQAMLSALPESIMTHSGQILKIVKQDGKPGHFSEHYAPRIYLSGEIQTRTENWHDFFQFLTWFMFPKTKAVINAIHIPAAKVRIEQQADPGRRSPIENMLSLFDEGGAVILSSDPSLLDLIRNFKWKELFWQRRDELADKLSFVTFGHAMYEKGLAPYVGMTANCILLDADESVVKQTNQYQLEWIDNALADLFTQGEQYKKPKDLSPFPLLGLPGWDRDNEHESYYNNLAYFRPGRKQK